MKQAALEKFFEKYRLIQSQLSATPMMELFLALVSNFQLLPNFTKNSILGS